MDKIDISVIILSYYHENYIGKAIDSVISQETDKLFEIIVGDDCSKDKTTKIIDEYKEKYPDIIKKMTYESNVGTTKNLCECIKQCRGDYITLLAGDDYFSNNAKLEIQSKWLKKHEDYIAVANTVQAVNSEGEPIRYYPRRKKRANDVYVKDFLKAEFYPVHGIMFRNNKVFKESNYESIIQIDRLVEDLPLCLLLIDIGKVHVLEDISYSYYIRNKIGKKESKNYNSTQSAYGSYKNHMNLIDGLESFYGLKYNMEKLRSHYLAMGILSSIKGRECLIFRKNVEKNSIKTWLYALTIYIPKTIWLVIMRKLFGEKACGHDE